MKLDDRLKQTTKNVFSVRIATSQVRIKVSLVGLITCNGLNGLSESHLFITLVNLKFQVVISFIFPFFSLTNHIEDYKRKGGNKKADQVSVMEANFASSRSFKEEAR